MTMKYDPVVHQLPTLDVRVHNDPQGCGTCTMQDTEEDAWRVGLEQLLQYREEWAQTLRTVERQLHQIDCHLQDYASSHPDAALAALENTDTRPWPVGELIRDAVAYGRARKAGQTL